MIYTAEQGGVSTQARAVRVHETPQILILHQEPEHGLASQKSKMKNKDFYLHRIYHWIVCVCVRERKGGEAGGREREVLSYNLESDMYYDSDKKQQGTNETQAIDCGLWRREGQEDFGERLAPQRGALKHQKEIRGDSSQKRQNGAEAGVQKAVSSSKSNGI